MNAICIKCWNPDAIVKLHLDGTKDLECGECEEVFNCAEVRDCLAVMQGKWAKLLKWVDACPDEEE